MTARRLWGVLGPALVAFALLALAEGGLRLTGFEVKFSAGPDPRPNMLPLFRPVKRNDGVAVMRRHDVKGTEFLREKPRNGFRVFVIGESSVHGFPWGPPFSFTRFLQDALAGAMPERTVEVVNCGILGIASWHTRRIAEEEVVRFAPDVVIIYTGHNDWVVAGPEYASPAVRVLSPLRLFQLAVVVNDAWRRWRHGSFDAQRLHEPNQAYGYARDRARGLQTLRGSERQWILTRFADNMRAMVRRARATGATVLVASLAQNLRDFPPGASRHRPDLDAGSTARWRAAVEEADRHAASEDCAGALANLDIAVDIDPRPALVHYARGRCLDRLGRVDGARDEYRLASDLDEIPLGAPSQVNAILADIAADTGAVFVDVLGALQSRGEHGLLGREFFVDHLHPSVAGHAEIARVLSRALGAPDDALRADAVAATARDPFVEQRMHGANVVLYMTLGWYDEALDEIDRGGRTFPDVLKLRPVVEQARDQDTVPARTDLPHAPD